MPTEYHSLVLLLKMLQIGGQIMLRISGQKLEEKLRPL